MPEDNGLKTIGYVAGGLGAFMAGAALGDPSSPFSSDYQIMFNAALGVVGLGYAAGKWGLVAAPIVGTVGYLTAAKRASTIENSTLENLTEYATNLAHYVQF